MAVVVSRVETPAEQRAFVRLPYSIYREHALWAPPLELEVESLLDRKKNPWFEFGAAELYLARRDGRVVGRIAALDDPRYNDFHKTRTGFFGLFECEDDPEAARALFGAAAERARARSHDTLVGPMNFSTNYECAMLIDGYDDAPVVMMPYNPPYYARLYEAAGLGKAKDLFAYRIPELQPPQNMFRESDRIKQRTDVTIRAANMRDYRNEIERIRDIYNAAWERNWGFVPMTDREIGYLADQLRRIAVPELVLIAEVKGEPVGFSMALPDITPALKAAGGRLFRFGLPIGFVKLWLAARKLKRIRFITLGVKAEYRKEGLGTVMCVETFLRAKQLGFTQCEVGWTLEDNALINAHTELFGGTVHKRYRIWQRPLA